jgi:hypothetical protein
MRSDVVKYNICYGGDRNKTARSRGMGYFDEDEMLKREIAVLRSWDSMTDDQRIDMFCLPVLSEEFLLIVWDKLQKWDYPHHTARRLVSWRCDFFNRKFSKEFVLKLWEKLTVEEKIEIGSVQTYFRVPNKEMIAFWETLDKEERYDFCYNIVYCSQLSGKGNLHVSKPFLKAIDPTLTKKQRKLLYEK